MEGGRYIVDATVVEVVHAPEGLEAPTSTYPVTLTLEKRGMRWMIVGATRGDATPAETT